MNKYEEILYLPHHTSSKRKPMSLESRSAQFAPFSALTGYEDEINEIGRLTDEKIELTEEAKEQINNQLFWLKNHKEEKFNITYFIKDSKKSGGYYQTSTTKLKKIDSVKQIITTSSNQKILIDNIVKIELLTYNNFV